MNCSLRFCWPIAVAALLATACSEDPIGDPSPPNALLRLTSPHIDDGAMLFTISGPPIDAISPTSTALRMFLRRTSDSTLVGALVGPIGSGAVLTLHRVSDPGAYVARVLEVADRRNVLRESLIGYALTVIR